MADWQFCFIEVGTNGSGFLYYFRTQGREELFNLQTVYSKINELGWLGWELASVTTDQGITRYYFKKSG